MNTSASHTAAADPSGAGRGHRFRCADRVRYVTLCGMRTWWGRRRRGERGATAVEYGLIVAGVAAVLLALPMLGMAIDTWIEHCAVAGLEDRRTTC